MNLPKTGAIMVENWEPVYDRPIVMDDVNCHGSENDLFMCSYTMDHNCDHREDVAVLCVD